MRQQARQSPTVESSQSMIWAPLTLEPNIENFLGEPTATQEAGENLLQEPLVENYEVWVEWRGHQVDMPDWWGELVAIPDIDDYQKLAQKIRASLKIPRVRSKAQRVENDYSLPTFLNCISQKAFLLTLGPKIPFKTTGKDTQGRPWCMHRYCNIGLIKPIHQSLANHTFC